MHKKPLYLLVGLFIAPILGAKLVLINGWYQGAKINTGTLISPPLTITNIHNAWLLLYNSDANCTRICQQSLWQIQQVHMLLAVEGQRLQHYVTSVFPLNDTDSMYSQTLPKLILTPAIQTQLSTDTLYLVDPLGNVFMRYQFPAEKIAALSVSAGLLTDLKRLLKISKIG